MFIGPIPNLFPVLVWVGIVRANQWHPAVAGLRSVSGVGGGSAVLAATGVGGGTSEVSGEFGLALDPQTPSTRHVANHARLGFAVSLPVGASVGSVCYGFAPWPVADSCVADDTAEEACRGLRRHGCEPLRLQALL